MLLSLENQIFLAFAKQDTETNYSTESVPDSTMWF